MSEDRYDIIKLLGKGRTGGVYEAEDSRLNRKVAMRRFFAQMDYTDIAVYEKEFKEIAQSLSALQHPNLLRVFDAGLDEDGAFIISQLLKGDTVHNRLKEGPMDDWDVWDMANQMLDALSSSHAAGFIHAAITPGSIMMTPRARGGALYVILDMGLSRLAPLIQGKDSVLSMMADPAILAPELFDGSKATESSDLYMLGNILFMSLIGGHPFAMKSIEECEKLHKKGLPPLTKYGIGTPPEFIAWITKLVAIKPEHRFASVKDALAELPVVNKPELSAPAGLVPPSNGGPATVMVKPTKKQSPARPALSSAAASTVTNSGNGRQMQQVHAHQSQALTTQLDSKSNGALKGILIAAGVAAVGLGGFLAFSGGGDTGKDTTKANDDVETKAGSQAADAKSESSKPVIPSKARPLKVSYRFDGLSGSTPRWNKYDPQFHTLTKKGLYIKGSTGKSPGVNYELSSRDIEGMYSSGWEMNYKVYVQNGQHTFGVTIGADENHYWGDKTRPASFLLHFVNEGGRVVLRNPITGKKSFVDKAKSGEYDVSIIVAPRDKTGAFRVKVNNKGLPGFAGVLDQGANLNKDYMNSVFANTGFASKIPAYWGIKRILLSIGKKK